MSLDDALRVLDGAARVLGVLVWPAVFLFAFLRIAPAVSDLLRRFGEISIKGAGLEFTAKPKAEALAALGAAAAKRADRESSTDAPAVDTKSMASVVAAVTPQALRRSARSRVLWVDDHPENNRYERQSLEALAITVEVAKTTDEAMARVRGRTYDLIISDMNRPPDEKAGLTLLQRLRAAGDKTPYVIYAGISALDHRSEARRLGALDCTNRPEELFERVTGALGGGDI